MSDAQRAPPNNEVALQMELTEPFWGKPEVDGELKAILKRIQKFRSIDPDTNEVKSENAYSDLWAMLSMYSRDVRLANLDANELHYIRWYLDFAAQMLSIGAIRSFWTSLQRAITVLESSQSKKGFLRKRQGTITSEQIGDLYEPKKTNNIFGMEKKGV